MALKFWKTKEKDKLFLSLDIGTEAVKALIFCKKKQINVLGVSLQYYKKYGIFDSRDFETDVIKDAILKAISKAKQNVCFSQTEKELKARVQKQKKWDVLLTLPPNQLRARVISERFLREKPKEKISKKEGKKFYFQVFLKAKEEISKKFAQESGILPQDIKWINLEIIEAKIGGYQVPSVEGYIGREVELVVLATFLPKHYFHEITGIIGSLKLKILKIVHETEQLTFLNKGAGIFLDIGGEITQVFLIEKGRIKQINEFNSGGKDFSERLSGTLGLDDEAAKRLKERYADNLLNIKTAERIREIFKQERLIWYNSLKECIKEMGLGEILPSMIYIFGGGGIIPDVEKVLKEGPINNAESAPTVERILPKELEGIKDLTQNLWSQQNVPCLLISLSNFKNAKKVF